MSEGHDKIPLDYQSFRKNPPSRFFANISAVAALISSLFVIELLHATVIPSHLCIWLCCQIVSFWAIYKTYRSSDLSVQPRRAIVATIIWILALISGVSSMFTIDSHYYPRHNRIGSDHLRAIGQAIFSYATEHGGNFPNSLEELVIAGKISSEDLICPFTKDVPATGPTTQSLAVDLARPHHDSFVYVGKGMTSSVSPDAVVAYQWPINSRGMGPFVLYGDGHVDEVNEQGIYQIISKLQVGHNPP